MAPQPYAQNLGVSGVVDRSVDDHSHGDQLGGLVSQFPVALVAEIASTGTDVLGVVLSGLPAGAHDVHAVVIVK